MRFSGALILAFVLVLDHAAVAESDARFLNALEQRSFRFFWEQANPATGLIPDSADAAGTNHPSVASIASVGFGLTGICIADERGWVSHEQAYQRARTTLRFLLDKLPQEHGFYYHFVDMQTGARQWNCELSSIDSALLLAGVLTARQYFRGTEVEQLATRIYERVDWPWMLNGGQTLSMGWTPEGGFLGGRWGDFSEHMVLYLLGLGSTTHPLPAATWRAWKREPVITYSGRTFLQCPPLFTHQYSQVWVDFRNKRDAFADYWRNSVLATLAHRQFCLDLASQFPTYSADLWGITSSAAPEGYKAWGGPPATVYAPIDGVIVPCAAGGSLPFAPQECLRTLRFMRTHYSNRVWKRYGFVDAFNPRTGWTAANVIGIDTGITLLMAENYRSGFVWKYFMKNPEIQVALNRAGFCDTTPTLPAADRQYLRQLAHDTWRCLDETLVEPTTGLPYDSIRNREFTSVSNIGLHLTDVVAAHDMGFISRHAAEQKLAQTLASLKKLKTTYGFQQCWNDVKTLQPGTNDTWISVVDSGNLVGGIITVAEAFPCFRAACDRLVRAMDWAAFYDKNCRQLLGGYNNATGKFNPDWHLPFLGADSRLTSFIAIASGKVPAESWDALTRNAEERYGTRYLVPGWQGGGLFMQYINGLWLDDRHTLMGQSAQNFAYAQIQHAIAQTLPAWGWSASDSPADGYLGWGKLRDNIVTPHASALAIGDFPREVVANLHALEQLGARDKRHGFYDAIDLSTGKVAKNFLSLDQSMLFISLVNYLRDDTIRRYFQQHPLVQHGRELIADYRQPAFGANTSLFILSPPSPDLREATQKTVAARRFNDWRTADWQMLDHSRFAFAWDDTALHFRADVRNADLVNNRPSDKLWEQDCVELFIDPQNDGLRWGDKADFQFGFAVTNKCWEWFGGRRQIKAVAQPTTSGYEVEATIPWSLLGVTPARGTILRVSPAIKNTGHGKAEWNWQPTGDHVTLGRLILE